MSTVSFKIHYPKTKAEMRQWMKDYSVNAYYSGKHWAVRQKDAEYWHLLTLSALNRHKIGSIPFDKPVEISLGWNDQLDVDNHAIMGKMIVDALKGRVIHNDNRRWFKGLYHYFHDEDYILVQIREID